MLKALKNLFLHHEHNNHRPKVLHLSSLYFFVILIVFFQLGLSFIQTTFPGVLGFAANISPEEIVRLTNEKRVGSGLNGLSMNGTLSQGAMQKGADMFAKNYWAHFAPDGTSPWMFFKSAGYSYLYAGENLARDFQNSGEVVQAWMNSQTHKDNILNSNYTEIGVAVLNGTLDGSETTLVVQFFGKPTVSYVAEAPSTDNKVPEIAQAEVARVPETKEVLDVLDVSEEFEQEELKQEEVKQEEPEKIEESQNDLRVKNENLLISPSPSNLGEKSGIFLGLSSFDLSKTFSLALLLLLLIVLIIDSILLVKKKVIRIGGKNLVHISFLVVILLIILLTTAGRII